MKDRAFNLQERFIDDAVRIIKVTEALPNTKTGNHILAQLFKSGTSRTARKNEEAKKDRILRIK